MGDHFGLTWADLELRGRRPLTGARAGRRDWGDGSKSVKNEARPMPLFGSAISSRIILMRLLEALSYGTVSEESCQTTSRPDIAWPASFDLARPSARPDQVERPACAKSRASSGLILFACMAARIPESTLSIWLIKAASRGPA
ncbi:hypothetical protein MES4922_100086 [Mesorhizobium ventifaucium]|uniref:Uncharacterized protein n=1 Tax=Mesorhizobium ventifaucium TaxID=666020 RepID=A0ABM9DD74_9HYPH|nr:hypothetical protein MES4922_100086 [Mesorhizobium ventifaucium]